MQTRVLRTAGELDSIRPVWERLHAKSRTATAFQCFAWNRLAADRFADREEPFVVVAEAHDGAAILPLARRAEELTFLGETLFDYRDFLADSTSAAEAAWSVVGDTGLPLRANALREGSEHSWWRSFRLERYSAAAGVRDVSAEKYAREHSKARKFTRWIGNNGARFRVADASPSLIADVLRRKADRDDLFGENLFRDSRRVDFVCALAALDPERWKVDVLEHGSELVAAMINFSDRGYRRHYNNWHSEEWAKYSPGVITLFRGAQEALREGLVADFMTGEQPYKLRLANFSVALYRIELTAEQVRAAIAPASQIAA